MSSLEHEVGCKKCQDTYQAQKIHGLKRTARAQGCRAVRPVLLNPFFENPHEHEPLLKQAQFNEKLF